MTKTAFEGRAATYPSSAGHIHAFRLIEVPEFTSRLRERTGYQDDMIQRVEGGYLCQRCGELGSVVCRGAQHPIHYLSSWMPQR